MALSPQRLRMTIIAAVSYGVGYVMPEIFGLRGWRNVLLSAATFLAVFLVGLNLTEKKRPPNGP